MTAAQAPNEARALAPDRVEDTDPPDHLRVSVVVPLYNVAEYVTECVDSLRRQTYARFEAIVVDDGSADDSFERAKTAAAGDDRFRFVQFGENRGLSAARNAGIDAARGDYVMFLDSDDLLVDDAMQTLVEAACADGLDLVDFASEPFWDGDEAARALAEEAARHRDNIEGAMPGCELFYQYVKRNQYFPEACYHFIRRNLLVESALRFEEGIIHEDELFSPLLHASATRARFLNEPLYRYRFRASSIVTSRRGIRNVAGLFRVTQSLDSWLHENATAFRPNVRDAYARRIWFLRWIMAYDTLQCTDEELEAFMAQLSNADRALFDLFALEHAKDIREHNEIVDGVYASATYRLGNTLALLPRKLREAASNVRLNRR